MGLLRKNGQAEVLAETGLVPASVCARLGGYSLSAIHRAIARGVLTGEQIGARRYVNWASFRAFVGPLADKLPTSAQAAVGA